jgi:uncharacterized protein YkwD
MKTLIVVTLLLTLLLPATATAAPDLVRAVNAERAERGLAPLERSKPLAASSRGYARFLMRRGLFQHPRRLWIAARFSLRGEVLALHRRRASARRTVAIWLGSPPHRAVLLHPRMRFVGAGQASGRFHDRPAVIRVLHAAR